MSYTLRVSDPIAQVSLTATYTTLASAVIAAADFAHLAFIIEGSDGSLIRSKAHKEASCSVGA